MTASHAPLLDFSVKPPSRKASRRASTSCFNWTAKFTVADGEPEERVLLASTSSTNAVRGRREDLDASFPGDAIRDRPTPDFRPGTSGLAARRAARPERRPERRTAVDAVDALVAHALDEDLAPFIVGHPSRALAAVDLENPAAAAHQGARTP